MFRLLVLNGKLSEQRSDLPRQAVRFTQTGRSQITGGVFRGRAGDGRFSGEPFVLLSHARCDRRGRCSQLAAGRQRRAPRGERAQHGNWHRGHCGGGGGRGPDESDPAEACGAELPAAACDHLRQDSTQPCHRRCEQRSSAPFCTKTDHFTKTGSGQPSGKSRKKRTFSCRDGQKRRHYHLDRWPAAAGCAVPLPATRCATPLATDLWRSFAKTGFGHTSDQT